MFFTNLSWLIFRILKLFAPPVSFPLRLCLVLDGDCWKCVGGGEYSLSPPKRHKCAHFGGSSHGTIPQTFPASYACSVFFFSYPPPPMTVSSTSVASLLFAVPPGPFASSPQGFSQPPLSCQGSPDQTCGYLGAFGHNYFRHIAKGWTGNGIMWVICNLEKETAHKWCPAFTIIVSRIILPIPFQLPSRRLFQELKGNNPPTSCFKKTPLLINFGEVE